VAAVLAEIVHDGRFSRRVFYVNSGGEPVEQALERFLASQHGAEAPGAE